jgi:ribonuclease HI
LAVTDKLHHRIPKISPVCPVCCSEVEDVHHCMVRCTLARALRDGMRSVWNLPGEAAFRYTGRNWLLLLLDGVNSDVRAKLLFLLWRTWHHRNNIVHGDGKASIAASIPFLQNYVESFCPGAPLPDSKGKAPVLPLRAQVADPRPVAHSEWAAPEPGWVKVNVDAGWQASSSAGGIGMVVRDEMGAVLLSEWKTLVACGSAEEAEMIACLEGIRYLAAYPQIPGILETDCSRLVAALEAVELDRSAHWSLILEAKSLLEVLPRVKLRRVSRVSNRVAHDLEQLGKRECGVLHRAVPSCLSDSLLLDCKNDVT